MKPGIRCLITLTNTIVLAGCVINSGHPPSLSPPELANASDTISNINFPCQKTVAVGPFNQVVFDGPMIVTVNGHQLEQKLVINGTLNPVRRVKVYVQDGVLYVKYTNFPLNYFNADKTVYVRLDLDHDINSITYDGVGSMNVENIGYNNLTVNVGGHANVNMTGDLVMSKIYADDDAVLTAYWIDSSNLQIITEENAKVLLGGVVTHLDVIASGNSEIDGKYLRTDDAYVKTSDNANVGISIKHLMSTWSLDNSTVYYYRDTDFSTSYLSKSGTCHFGTSGSSLRMVGIDNTFPNE